MIILGSGCSYTHMPKAWGDKTQKSWLWHLEDIGYEVYNYSQGSGGNQLSTRALIYATEKYHKNKDIMVIRQISGIARSAFLVEDGDSLYFQNDKYDWMLEQDKNFPNDDDTRYSHQTSRYGIANFSTGSWGEKTEKTYWRKIHPMNVNDSQQYNMEKVYYEHFGTYLHMVYETLESMLYLQTYCDSRNIPHLQFFGWDVFADNGWRLDYENYLEYDDCKVLVNAIDWNKVITYNYDFGWVWKGKHDKQMMKCGGIHEYALSELDEEDWFYEEKDYESRFGHPHSNAHKSFAKNILSKKIKELY